MMFYQYRNTEAVLLSLTICILRIINGEIVSKNRGVQDHYILKTHRYINPSVPLEGFPQ